MDFEAILTEATAAAEAAIAAKGPENMNALDCGFAWVNISGTEPLARYCRKMINASGANATPANLAALRKYGGKGYPSGWEFWKPGGFNGQAIGHHEAGARAFNEVLARHNIRGTVGSRYD
jgi:hypothetical protein